MHMYIYIYIYMFIWNPSTNNIVQLLYNNGSTE